jgi:perosamine synthetase
MLLLLFREKGETPMETASADTGPQIGTQAAASSIIPVYRPDLSGNERRYVLDCLETTWISSLGVYIERFEEAAGSAIGVRHAIGVCNGTVALHLALHCLGIGPGDEVIVPTFTYIASVNAIAQTGATPVFAECRAWDWLLDPADASARITPRTKAILPVHLYGLACDMPALTELADNHRLAIVEDCAEAIGTTLHGQHVGTFGNVGTFSFFGNKTITTGEGGMLVTQDEILAKRLRIARGQGQSLTRRYWHETLGFNYRMTNIVAAIGLAQMERLEEILVRKRAIGIYYRTLLDELPVTLPQPSEGTVRSDWLISVLLPPDTDRDRVMAEMSGRGVETRPVFYCANEMPMYATGERFPVSKDIAARGISLPSYPMLTYQDIDRIVETLAEALRAQAV